MIWQIPYNCPDHLARFARKIGTRVRHKMNVRLDPNFDPEFESNCITAFTWGLVYPGQDGMMRPMDIWGPEPDKIDYVLRINCSLEHTESLQKITLMHELGHAVDAHKSPISTQVDVARAWGAVRDLPKENAASVPLRFRNAIYQNEWAAWDLSENWLDLVDIDLEAEFYRQRKFCLDGYADFLQVKKGRP